MIRDSSKQAFVNNMTHSGHTRYYEYTSVLFLLLWIVIRLKRSYMSSIVLLTRTIFGHSSFCSRLFLMASRRKFQRLL